jgi:mRNA interferase MazF
MRKSGKEVEQFMVYSVELDPAKGKEIKKTRPCVVISPTAMNDNLPTVIVAPLTHTIKSFPTRVFSQVNGEEGQVVLEQIRAVDKNRLKKKFGMVDLSTAENIKLVMQTMFS